MKTATITGTKQDGRVSPNVRSAIARTAGVKIENILVPIDFSPASLMAVEFALPLLKQFRANLHLVHVSEPQYPLSSMVALPLVVSESEIGKRVRHHLNEVARKAGIDLRPENIHALRGRPAEEICRFARKQNIDLIITATRGNTGLKHLVLGSTAERVVRYSPCPVLVVRGGKQADLPRNGTSRNVFQIKRIFVPIDFSDCSMKGLAYAEGLARKFDAALILMNSVHVQYFVTIDEYARYDLPALEEEAEKASRRQMSELMAKTDWQGLKVESLLQTGHPGDQICVQAKDRGADLIVTSTHGTTGFKHILLGSTAEYVVRHADMPVLIVPSHERPTLPQTRTKK